MTKNNASSSKKRPSQSPEEESSNEWCGACGQSLYGNQDATTTTTTAASTTIGKSVDSSLVFPTANYELKLSDNAVTDAKNRDATDLSSNLLSISSNEELVVRRDFIVTCSNMSGPVKCCRAHLSGGNSPHYHFTCLKKLIPSKSKLYSDLCRYANYQEEENKRKKIRSSFRSPIGQVPEEKLASNLNSVHIQNNVPVNNNRESKLPDRVPLDKSVHLMHRGSLSSDESGRSTASNRKYLTKNPFICDACDMEGSSRYLSEYFDNFRTVKKKFYGDDEAIDAIHPISNLASSDEEMMEGSSFVQYLMGKELDANLNVSSKATELRISRIRQVLQCTIMSQEHNDMEHKSTLDFDEPITPNYLIGQPVRLYCSLTNSYHTGRIIDARHHSSVDTTRLKPSTVKRYIGIQSSTKKSPIREPQSTPPVLLDRDIGRTQYLVRFRARMEGRRSTVHQWLYLEEHPLMVGVAIVWINIYNQDQGDVDRDTSQIISMCRPLSADACTIEGGNLSADTKGAKRSLEKLRRLKRSKAKFYPGQIFLRSALEMMHVDEINPNHCDFTLNPLQQSNLSREVPHPEGFHVIALIFDDVYKCVRLKMEKQSSAVLQSQKKESEDIPVQLGGSMPKTGRELNVEYMLGVLGKSFKDISFADFRNPPPDVKEYLQVLHAHDESLVRAIVSACSEEEEQMRALLWHNNE